MALDKDILGTALHTVRNNFNNKTKGELEQQFGSIEAARLALAKAEAEAIINHFKNNADGIYQLNSLVAGPNAVTPVGLSVAVKLN